MFYFATTTLQKEKEPVMNFKFYLIGHSTRFVHYSLKIKLDWTLKNLKWYLSSTRNTFGRILLRLFMSGSFIAFYILNYFLYQHFLTNRNMKHQLKFLLFTIKRLKLLYIIYHQLTIINFCLLFNNPI